MTCLIPFFICSISSPLIAPLSPDKEQLSSLSHRLSPEGSIDNGSFPLGVDPSTASPTDFPAADPDEALESEELTRKSLTQDGTEPDEDWSDWEDADAPGQNQPIRSPVRTASESSPPKTLISSLKGTGKPLKLKDMVPPKKETPVPKTANTAAKPKDSIKTAKAATTRSAPLSTTKWKKGTLDPNQDFGIYDIPEVKLKSRPNPEDDLFAEMEPKLSFSSKTTSETTKTAKKKDSPQDDQTPTAAATSFAVANDGDEVIS